MMNESTSVYKMYCWPSAGPVTTKPSSGVLAIIFTETFGKSLYKRILHSFASSNHESGAMKLQTCFWISSGKCLMQSLILDDQYPWSQIITFRSALRVLFFWTPKTAEELRFFFEILSIHCVNFPVIAIRRPRRKLQFSSRTSSHDPATIMACQLRAIHFEKKKEIAKKLRNILVANNTLFDFQLSGRKRSDKFGQEVDDWPPASILKIFGNTLWCLLRCYKLWPRPCSSVIEAWRLHLWKRCWGSWSACTPGSSAANCHPT